MPWNTAESNQLRAEACRRMGFSFRHWSAPKSRVICHAGCPRSSAVALQERSSNSAPDGLSSRWDPAAYFGPQLWQTRQVSHLAHGIGRHGRAPCHGPRPCRSCARTPLSPAELQPGTGRGDHLQSSCAASWRGARGEAGNRVQPCGCEFQGEHLGAARLREGLARGKAQAGGPVAHNRCAAHLVRGQAGHA